MVCVVLKGYPYPVPPRNGFLFPFLNSTRVGGRCRSPTRYPSAIKGGAPAGAFTEGITRAP